MRPRRFDPGKDVRQWHDGVSERQGIEGLGFKDRERKVGMEALYRKLRCGGRMMAHHMDYLRSLSVRSTRCVEFGVRGAVSTVALLAGGSKLDSWDVQVRPTDGELHEQIMKLACGQWGFHLGDSRKADIPECDLLLHDSVHNYDHVKAELDAHAHKVRRWIVFHDTIVMGSYGQKPYAESDMAGTAGGADETVMGIRLAIDELMIEHPEWRIVRHDPNSSGLLTIEKLG